MSHQSLIFNAMAERTPFGEALSRAFSSDRNPSELLAFTENAKMSRQLVSLAEQVADPDFLVSRAMVTDDEWSAYRSGRTPLKSFGVQKILECLDARVS